MKTCTILNILARWRMGRIRSGASPTAILNSIDKMKDFLKSEELPCNSTLHLGSK